MESFIKAIAHLLFLKNFYHNGHHIVSRAVFFSDHAALGDFYNSVDDEYDSLAEKFCALFGCEKLSLAMIMSMAAEKAKLLSHPKENKEVFTNGLQFEVELCTQLETMIKTIPLSEGTKQLLGNLCESSEARQYKIKQRVK